MKPIQVVRVLDDGCCLVSLCDDQHTVSCTVSSMHLVEEKRPQLKRALQAMKQQQQG